MNEAGELVLVSSKLLERPKKIQNQTLKVASKNDTEMFELILNDFKIE